MVRVSSWENVRLGDILNIKHGWPFKTEFISEELTGKPIVVNIGNFKYTGGFRFETTRVREYHGEYPQEYELESGDILLVMTCQTSEGEILGIPARVPDDGQIYLHNQRLGKAVVTHPEKADSEFLYWLFLWHEFNRWLFTSSSGTKILHTAPKRIESFEFGLPPLNEQHAIASILNALDTKMELNEQMSKTLQAIGRAIFKHWFIDFEFPNEEGKPYKSSRGEMVYDEEIGREIPEGWKTGKLAETAVQLRDQISPCEHPERIYRHLSIEAFDSGMRPQIQPGSEILSNKFVVQKGTVLVSKLNPRIQRIWPVSNIGENSICSTEFLVFKPKNGLFCYFYYLVLSNRVKKDLEQMARGTSSSHQRISADDLRNIPVLIPSKRVMELFENMTLPILIKQEQGVVAQITLAQIRDSLLPRLMSGKIRIPVEAR